MWFEYKAKIYGFDCDIYGHLNNANYQHIYEAARAEMLEEIGLSIAVLLDKGFHIYVRKITLEYLKAVPLGSEVTVKSRIDFINRVRSVWIQEMCSEEGVLYNRAKVEGVFARNGKPVRIPVEMEKIFKDVTGE